MLPLTQNNDLLEKQMIKNKGTLLALSVTTLIVMLFNLIIWVHLAGGAAFAFFFIGGDPSWSATSRVFWILSSLLQFTSILFLVLTFVMALKSVRFFAILFALIGLVSYLISSSFRVGSLVTSPNWGDSNNNIFSLIKLWFFGSYNRDSFFGYYFYIRGILTIILLISTLTVAYLTNQDKATTITNGNIDNSEVNVLNLTSTLQTESRESMPSENQWKVKLPGQPDQAVDTSTLKMWARSGVIRPDTLILDINNNMSYAASQIPNVFSSKSYVTALLLSFFLGALGVDRFYLGHSGLGIGKLLTLGGCGIWALIDFILIAIRKVTDSDGNPLA